MQDKKILLISHDLCIAGAQIVLLNFAKILIQQGYSCTVISFFDGDLRKEYEKIGISVKILSHNFDSYPDELISFAKNYDLVVANTVISYKFVDILSGVVPLIWYIHEAHNIPEFFDSNPGLEDTLRKADNIYAVSEYAKDFIVKNYNENVQVIHNYVEDVYAFSEIAKDNFINFSIVGYMTKRKAFHICIDSFLALSEDIRKKCILKIVGDLNTCTESYWKPLKENTKNEKNIVWHGQLKGYEKNKIFSKTDVFVVPSFDEAGALVPLEACMMGKALIVSENVGTKYMVDSSNGWIVKTGDTNSLKQAFESAVMNVDKLKKMGELSRKKYEKLATFDSYEKAVKEIVQKHISNEHFRLDLKNKKTSCSHIFTQLKKERKIIKFLGIKISINKDCNSIIKKIFNIR